MSKIKLVRFADYFPLGLDQGQYRYLEADNYLFKVDGHQVAFNRYDDVFLEIVIRAPVPYSQMIPWANVASVFFEAELKAAKDPKNQPK